MDENIPYPVSREETYLANIAGQNVEVPPCPVTRVERYLDYIAKHGSGGTDDYNALNNLPTINGIELKGNKTTEELGIKEYDDSEIRQEISDVNDLAEQNERDITNLDIDVTALEEKVKDLELFKFPNLTIIGTPTIQSGQVSDFTTSDYLEFPFLVDFRNQPFEINFAFTTGTDVTTQQNILDSEYGLAFAIRNSRLVLAISYDGATWAFESVGTLEITPDTTYRVKITWNRLVYTVSYSTDGGETYTQDISHASAGQPYPKQMYIGAGKLATNAFGGSVNLNFANLLVNGEVVWTGMDDAGLASRLATDLSNVDAAGEAKIKEIASTVAGGVKKIEEVPGPETAGELGDLVVCSLAGSVGLYICTIVNEDGTYTWNRIPFMNDIQILLNNALGIPDTASTTNHTLDISNTTAELSDNAINA